MILMGPFQLEIFYDSMNSFSSHDDISAAGVRGEQKRPSCGLQPQFNYAGSKKKDEVG